MIDDLSTRAALTVAALLFLATGLSVISLSGGSSTRESARDLAGHVARELDAIGRMDAEVRVRFGPTEGAGVRLPVQIGGHPYRLEIRATDVRVIAQSALAAEGLQVRVHLFVPERSAYSETELRDTGPVTLIVPSGASVDVVRTALLVDGQPRFLTFASAA
jgi:hypothetical protein